MVTWSFLSELSGSMVRVYAVDDYENGADIGWEKLFGVVVRLEHCGENPVGKQITGY